MTALRDRWSLDPDVTFLNHGSFGACPRSVLDHQQELRDRLERNPVRLLSLELEELLAAALEESAAFVGADVDGFAFVPNATTGINAMLRSASLEPGDEILITDHEYEACALAAEVVAAERGVSVRTAAVPLPVDSPGQVIDAVLAAITPATRLAVIDHVTSASALVLPVAEIVAALAEHGIDTIVDGAHAPGMVEVDVASLGCSAYVGNWHKWVCAPKGAGFLWVSPEGRERARPVVVSHGAGRVPEGMSPFRARFDWLGTGDPTPFLTAPFAIATVGDMLDGGWAEVRRRNREVALGMRGRIAEASGLQPTGPEAMVGSMASFLIGPPASDPWGRAKPLLRRFADEFGVIVGVSATRASMRLCVRVSAHLHTEPADVEPFLEALAAMGEIRS